MIQVNHNNWLNKHQVVAVSIAVKEFEQPNSEPYTRLCIIVQLVTGHAWAIWEQPYVNNVAVAFGLKADWERLSAEYEQAAKLAPKQPVIARLDNVIQIAR